MCLRLSIIFNPNTWSCSKCIFKVLCLSWKHLSHITQICVHLLWSNSQSRDIQCGKFMVKYQENTQRLDESAGFFSYVLLGGYFTFHLSIFLVAWYFKDRVGMALSQALHYEFHSNSKTVHILFLTSSLVAGVKPVARPLGSCLFLKMAPVRIQACATYIGVQFNQHLITSTHCSTDQVFCCSTPKTAHAQNLKISCLFYWWEHKL